MSERNEERRRAERYTHKAYTTISAQDKTYTAHLLNISQTGALIAIIDGHNLHAGDHIQLSSDELDLYVDADVAHVKSHYIGVRYKVLNETNTEKIQTLIQQIKRQKD